MAESKHTPGPWKCGELSADLPGYEVYTGDGECRICEVDAEMVTHDQAVADTKLIVAAPDLLAACEAALDEIGCYTLGTEEARRKKPIEAVLRAALAKAKAE